MTNPQMAALVAFFVSLGLSLAKGVIWILSGSSTVLASLADSIQDTIISATNFMAVRYAMQPADEDHRYGHGKMEGIAALGQAAFILGSCVFIVLDSIRHFTSQGTIAYPILTITVICGAIIVNAALVFYQSHVVKSSGSLAIEADQAHYSGDIGIHLGVIIGVVAGHYFNLWWVDPIIAIAIALWLARLAYGIGKKAVDMLMDKELPEEDREKIKKIIRKTKNVLGFHDLRTHKSGQVVMISFDIEADPSLSLRVAHDITKKVQENLEKAYPKAEIMIHIDPCGDIADSRHKKIKKHHVK